jgi:hypothetical protein
MRSKPFARMEMPRLCKTCTYPDRAAVKLAHMPAGVQTVPSQSKAISQSSPGTAATSSLQVATISDTAGK